MVDDNGVDAQFVAAGDYEGAEDDVVAWAIENGVDVDEALDAYHAGDSSFFGADDSSEMDQCAMCGEDISAGLTAAGSCPSCGAPEEFAEGGF